MRKIRIRIDRAGTTLLDVVETVKVTSRLGLKATSPSQRIDAAPVVPRNKRGAVPANPHVGTSEGVLAATV